MPDEPNTVTLTYQEEGSIDRRRLSGVLGAATTFLLLLLIVALSLGAVGAVGVGIGGFVIEFSDVTAPTGSVYPALAQQSECDSAPQIMATLDGQSRIQGYFQITKGIPVPGSAVDGVSVDILSEARNNSSINAENLDLYMTALSSSRLTLGDMRIYERGPSDNGTVPLQDLYAESDENTSAEAFRPGFTVDSAGGFAVLNGRAVVYQIAFDNIEIGTISVSGSTYDTGNATLAGGYDCDELQPPQRNNNSEFTLPGEGNVTSSTPPPVDNSEPSEPSVSSGSGAEPNTDETDNRTSENNETVETDENSEDGVRDEGEPELEVVDVTPPQDAHIEPGDRITVEVNVSNVGNATERWGVYMQVENDVDNVTADSRTVELEPGESTELVLEHEATPADLPRLDSYVGVESSG